MAEDDLLRRLLDAGMTFSAMTQARAESLIRDLVRQGEVQAEQAQATIDELLDRSRRNSERWLEAVRSEIDQQIANLNLATRDDIERLVQRFADVAATAFHQMMPDRFGGQAAPTPGKAAPAKAPAQTTATATAPTKQRAATKTGATRVTFVVRNAGKMTHEFVVLKTTKAAGRLAARGAREAPETGAVGEIEEINPGEVKRLTLTLRKGHYSLICNLPFHYGRGQFVDFYVR